MKKVLFAIFLSIPMAQAAEFEPDIILDKIIATKSNMQVHRMLLDLKRKNKVFKTKLLKEKSYKPDVFHYTVTLENLLDKIPKNYSALPSCQSYVRSVLSDYQTSWDQLSAPNHHMWRAVKKICKKTQKH